MSVVAQQQAAEIHFLPCVASILDVCWYRAAVQWTTVYGRSIMGAYVPGGSHRDMQGKYSSR